MKPAKTTRFIIPVAICLVYILLRFWHLTDSCLWFDEIFSIHAAEHGWSELFWFTAQDLIHPPLFYVFLKLWIAFGGESLFWLRTFPVFFSILALLPFYLLCRQFKLSVLTIALAFTFFTVNGSLIKYAQEVRMYSLLMCLSLFSLWLFARFLNVGKGIWFLTLVNILLVHTQYFGWFIVIGEILTVLYLQRIKIGQTLIMFGITLAASVPWFITVFEAAQVNGNVSQNLGWADRPGLQTIIQFAFNLLEPFYYKASSLDQMSVFIISIPLLLVFLTAAAFYFVNRKAHSEKEKNAFAFLLIIILTPVMIAFAASWVLPFSIWGTRHFIIIFAPVMILAAKFLGNIEKKSAKFLTISLVLILFLTAFIWQMRRGSPDFIWCAWEDLAAKLPPENSAQPQKLLVFDDLIAYHFWFALRNKKNVQITKINGVPDMNEDKAYFLPRGFNGVQTGDPNTLTGDKFYIAFYAQDFNYLKQPLRILTEKGYQISDPQVFEAQGLKAFLVEVKR